MCIRDSGYVYAILTCSYRLSLTIWAIECAPPLPALPRCYTGDMDEKKNMRADVLGKMCIRDRVMEAGRAVQFAPPEEILRAPATEFVNRLVSRKQSVYAR